MSSPKSGKERTPLTTSQLATLLFGQVLMGAKILLIGTTALPIYVEGPLFIRIIST